MKDKLAIAAVMSTIRVHLERQLMDRLAGLQVDVTVLSPDKLSDDANAVNLFLYELRLNPAFRNQPLPGRVRPGETAPPPLPINLRFLLSAHANANTELNTHRILGSAMAVLHDTPVLGPIRLPDDNAEGGFYEYQGREHVRITPQPLTFTELTNLWSAFKGPIAPCMAYEVGAVLMESDRPIVIPPPVLRRGADDEGPVALASPTPPFPKIKKSTYGGADADQIRRRPSVRPVFELNDEIVFEGHFPLSNPPATRPPVARLRRPGQGPPVRLPTLDFGADKLRVRLDPGVVRLAGLHHVFVETEAEAGRKLTSEDAPLRIAATITMPVPQLSFPQPVQPEDPRPPQILTLSTRPALPADQDVRLLIGGLEIVRTPPAQGAPTTSAVFSIPEIPRGNYPLRLRVDGVDSLPIITNGTLAIGPEITVNHA